MRKQDVGSKLKTVVNDKDTGGTNEEVALKEGDMVKVGSASSVMRQALSSPAIGSLAHRKAAVIHRMSVQKGMVLVRVGDRKREESGQSLWEQRLHSVRAEESKRANAVADVLNDSGRW